MSTDSKPTKPASEKSSANSAHDAEEDPTTSQTKLSPARKALAVGIVSWISLCTSFGSTSLFPATDMILHDLSTISEVLDISNAITLICMGLSSLIWSPISSITGSRTAYIIATFLLMVFCIATALAPNIEAFVVTRLIGGFQGTWFMVGGQDLIANMFVPTQRGTAIGFFLAGTVIGPALGPCIGGLVVTYASWRIIFWIQAGMTGLGLILAFFFLPSLDIDEKNAPASNKRKDLCSILKSFDPCPTLKMLLVPRICINNFTCASISWAQYSLLVSPHKALYKVMGSDNPIVNGLFYLAPGAGFIVGTIVGGRFADMAVKYYIQRRGGERWPEDRLNAALSMLFGIIPGSLVIYGGFMESGVSGIVIPAITALLAGFGIMFAFSALNTYAVECAPENRQETVIGKYIVQYMFSAAASGATGPLIDRIGVLATTGIGAALVVGGGALTLALTKGKFVNRTPVNKKLTLVSRTSI